MVLRGPFLRCRTTGPPTSWLWKGIPGGPPGSEFSAPKVTRPIQKGGKMQKNTFFDPIRWSYGDHIWCVGRWAPRPPGYGRASPGDHLRASFPHPNPPAPYKVPKMYGETQKNTFFAPIAGPAGAAGHGKQRAGWGATVLRWPRPRQARRWGA